jgi:hypothetical protein
MSDSTQLLLDGDLSRRAVLVDFWVNGCLS